MKIDLTVVIMLVFLVSVASQSCGRHLALQECEDKHRAPALPTKAEQSEILDNLYARALRSRARVAWYEDIRKRAEARQRRHRDPTAAAVLSIVPP